MEAAYKVAGKWGVGVRDWGGVPFVAGQGLVRGMRGFEG